MKKDLSIIIINYNTQPLLKRCLESIKKENLKNFELIVIDNGSTDESTTYLSSLEWPNLKLIKNQKNLGFAKAVNQGIKKSQAEYILLINSDIIVRPKSIEKMVEFAKKHPEVGVVGGRLLNPDGSMQGSCFHLPTVGRVMKEFWFKDSSVLSKYVPAGETPVEVEAVVGAVFLIPKKVVDQVGLFDERFFMYFEDLDYCRRVKQKGFKVYHYPQSEFIHEHGASGVKLSDQTHQWLAESSKIYHGRIKYFLITWIIRLGQKFLRPKS
ncbi:glycosyltransferase family 2 protein [Candidatus Shapirobacteria bacterium]|nr:glycosyltransferase family 2 protein [Candidatus Shapirobacteria bacterium]